jgi:hypothetical protein
MVGATTRLDACRQQAPSNATLELKPGAFHGSNEAAVFSGINDWLYIAPAEKLSKSSSNFTIAVSFAKSCDFIQFFVKVFGTE